MEDTNFLNNLGYLDLDDGTFGQCTTRPSFPTSKHDVSEILDNATYGLLRDDYVSKLVQMCGNQEDSVIHYRQTLLSRARSIEGCPKAKLVTRRTTGNKSAQIKYANDCYLLNQFIAGDTSIELKDVFSKAPCSLSIPATPTTPVCSGNILTLNSVNNAVAELTSNLMKWRSDIQVDIEKISKSQNDLIHDIKEIRTTLLEDEAALCDVFNEEVQELGLNPTRSNKLKMVFNKTRTHGKQRSTIMNRCDDIERKLNENSGHIDNLLDKSVGNGNDKKMSTQAIEDHLNTTINAMKLNEQYVIDQVMNNKSKIKSVEKKVDAWPDQAKHMLTNSMVIFSEETTKAVQEVQIEISRLKDNDKQNTARSYTEDQHTPNASKLEHSSSPDVAHVHQHIEMDNQPNDDARIPVKVTHEPFYIINKPPDESYNCIDVNANDMRIPVMVSNTTKRNMPTPIFQRQFIGGVYDSDTVELIHYHLAMKGIRFYGVKIMQSKFSSKYSASAHVHFQDLHKLQSHGFWPDGVYSRSWIYYN